MQCGSCFECYNIFYGNDNTHTHRVSRRCYRLCHRRRRCNATNKRNPFFFLCSPPSFLSTHNRRVCIQSERESIAFSTAKRGSYCLWHSMIFSGFFFGHWMSVISKMTQTKQQQLFGPTINLIIHSCLFNTRPIAKWRRKNEQCDMDTAWKRWHRMTETNKTERNRGKTNGME